MFSRETVVQQIRSYQILETLHLMAAGLSPLKIPNLSFLSLYRWIRLKVKCSCEILQGFHIESSTVRSMLATEVW